MALRVTSLDQLAACHPAVKAQLEAALADVDTVSSALEASGIAAAPQNSVRRGRPEQQAGAMLVQWVQTLTLPNGLRPWDFFYHVPNGGFRSAIEARIFYGQGVRAGWPDYGLDLPLGRYHGMRLELKAPDGAKPTGEQLDILQRLESVGYYVRVAWGFEEARGAIEQYLAFCR